MKIIDISWPISSTMTEYKDRKTISLRKLSQSNSDVQETMICFKSHIGTHIDAPSHFIPDGITIDQIPLQYIIGSCTVLDLVHCKEKINKKDIEHYDLHKNDIILCKTTNSFLEPMAPFDYKFVYMTVDAAEFLVQKNIKAVGIDYLGIERDQPDHGTHKAFMRNNIPIIEGLRLKDVQPGSYFLWCLPLAIVGIDAAPARAVLVSE